MRLRQHSHFGFTLLELVVVIAVLAILATVAIQSLSGVEDQSRYDSTTTSLNNLSAAVQGTPGERDADQTPLITGFVADIGRLPNAFGSDPTTQLQELWSNPNNLLPMAVRTSTDDPAVTLATGWRGGYLRLGTGQTSLLDGWGNPFDLLEADGITPCASGTPVAEIRSDGADHVVTSTPASAFDANQIVPLNAFSATISGAVYQFNPSSGQLVPPTGTVTVYFFSPDPNTGGIAEQSVSLSAPPYTYSFPQAGSTTPVTVGPRVVRAYLGAGPSGATAESIPVRLVLQPGANIKDLVMQ